MKYLLSAMLVASVAMLVIATYVFAQPNAGASNELYITLKLCLAGAILLAAHTCYRIVTLMYKDVTK